MPVYMEPITITDGEGPRVTVDEVYCFARLDATLIQPSEVEKMIEFAAHQVDYISPVTKTERSDRADKLRKDAELRITTAELYEIIATYFAITTPPKQILSVLNLQIGADFPTPDVVQRAFERTADRYREEAKRLLAMIRPITFTIESGYDLDDE